jgi:hypothetical protein
MRSVPVVVSALAAALAVLAAASPATPRTSAERAEVQRIRVHFDSVLAELPGRDLSALTPAQRRNRAGLVATLQAYRDRGVFPHNYDFPGQAVPYFVDRKTGTLCAVAHLLESTGRRDIVDRVARADNNVWVPQLAGDTAFAAWLDANGITLAEAARIQVPYEAGPSPAIAVGVPIVIVSSAATTLWNGLGNRDGHNRFATIFGAVSGMATVGLGAAATSDGDEGIARVGLAAMALGGVATGVAIHTAVSRYRTDFAKREAAKKQTVARAVITPILPAPGKNGAGLAINVSF